LAFTGTRQNDTQELLYAKSNSLSSEKDWAKKQVDDLWLSSVRRVAAKRL